MRYLAKLTGSIEVAAELVQDTFVRAMRSDADPRGIANPRAWLFRVATNTARDRYRRSRRIEFVSLAAHEDTLATGDAQLTLVHEALATLSPRDATTLLLHYDSGFSRREIAEIDGITEEAVKTRIRRSRARFMESYRRLTEVS